MNPTELEKILEAALFANAEPLTMAQLQAIFPVTWQPEREEIKEALENLRQHYENRGVQLQEVASGYHFITDIDTAEYTQRLLEKKPPRYSRALLETLALIVYRQPITRGEIEQVRGVAVSSNMIKTLLDRDWIKAVGHKAVPGKPALYATTKAFLDYFNVKSVAQLPPLSELVDIESLGETITKQLALNIPEQDGLNPFTDTILGGEAINENPETSELLEDDEVRLLDDEVNMSEEEVS